MKAPISRLLLECTATYRYDYYTGIPRVVRNVIRHLHVLAAERGCEVVPVHFVAGGLYRVALTPSGDLASRPKSWRARIREAGRTGVESVARVLPDGALREWLVAPGSEPGLARTARRIATATRLAAFPPPPGEIEAGPGDRLLLIDVSLGINMRDTLAKMARAGVPVGALIYDLIPLQRPQWWPPGFPAAFADWVAPVLEHADLLVAISASVANDLRDYRATLPATSVRSGQAISWFHLGHDLDPIPAGALIRPRLAALFEADPVLLNVGWLDPRKNQVVLFEALKQVLASGTRVRLLLVGKRGVGGGPVIERVARDPVLSRQVTIMDDLTDAELDYAFRHARALVYPSLAEGFGLPLVEALARGLPAFASDLPVFRETSEGFATFCNPNDPQQLAVQLLRFLHEGRDPALRPLAEFHWPTWKASVSDLLERLFAGQPERATP